MNDRNAGQDTQERAGMRLWQDASGVAARSTAGPPPTHHCACASCPSQSQAPGASRASRQLAGGRRWAASAAGRPDSSTRHTPLPLAATGGTSRLGSAGSLWPAGTAGPPCYASLCFSHN